jgi:2-iminobutanoate/2-iminopropanoate deaminase
MNDFAKVNSIYAKYFEKDPPARVALAVATLPKNALVEIDAIVAYP